MTNKQIKPVDNGNILHEPDMLLEICRILLLNEARIFLVGLVMANMQLKTHHVLRNVLVPTKELVNMFGNNKAYYSEISKVAERLREKVIILNEQRLPIFREIKFSAENGGLTMMFNPQLTPLIADLASRNYIIVLMRISFILNSIYALRILIILLRVREYYRIDDCVNLTVNLEDIRYCLAIPNTATYQQITNIRNKVLNKPINDINRNNIGFKVGYDVVKNGRKVSGFLFTMKKCG